MSGGPVQADHLVQHLIGTALKDAADDLKKLRHYFNHVDQGAQRPRLEGVLRGAGPAAIRGGSP